MNLKQENKNKLTPRYSRMQMKNMKTKCTLNRSTKTKYKYENIIWIDR